MILNMNMNPGYKESNKSEDDKKSTMYHVHFSFCPSVIMDLSRIVDS